MKARDWKEIDQLIRVDGGVYDTTEDELPPDIEEYVRIYDRILQEVMKPTAQPDQLHPYDILE